MHSRININIFAILKALDFRILEHFNILLPNINEDAGDPVWEAPPHNVIKINPVNIGPSIPIMKLVTTVEKKFNIGLFKYYISI
jgi:hypothetical protein